VIPICFPSPAAEALVMDPQPGPKGPQPSAAMFAATSDHEVPSSCRLEQENVGNLQLWPNIPVINTPFMECIILLNVVKTMS
jgi:hypothetical protein